MPETLRLHADRPEDMERAAEILRAGGLVAFPTETVYGLGANALSVEAVTAIFEAKQRPAWDPLIVHIADRVQLEIVAQLEGDLAKRVQLISDAFWPGPLTLLLPRTSIVPDEVTAGRALVGVRWPAHPVALALLRAAGVPIAAPSANRFGHVSPTTAQHVLHDLDGRIDAVLDGGATSVGVESTVLDPAQTPMLLYRAGAVTPDMLRGIGFETGLFEGTVEVTANPASLPSPGVGIRHYAPEARLLLSGPSAGELSKMVRSVKAEDSGRVGVLVPRDWAVETAEVMQEPWGRWRNPDTLASELFAGLRALEIAGAAVIVCPLPEAGGIRDALRDRLLKAARPR